MIAEVRRVKLPTPLPEAPQNQDSMADEAANAPGSEQLMMLVDRNRGEGLVIHLWNDQAAYETFAEQREKLVEQSAGHGMKVDPTDIYEVTYRS